MAPQTHPAIESRARPGLRNSSPEARRAAERRLFQRYRRFGDDSARERLVDWFLPLADRLARRHRRSGEPLEDVVQVARMGLIKAVDRFDPDRPVAFTSFAAPTIVGELRRYYRDFGWSVHVPRGLKERVLAVEAAAAELIGQLGRSPSPGEIAKAAGMSTEYVLEALEVAATADPLSLDAPLGSEEDGTQCLAETVGAGDGRLELVERAATVKGRLSELPSQDRLILHLRFFEGLSQSEIAEQVGVSQMQVSRRLRRCLDRLAANNAPG